jgi:hypothetical protein
VSSTTPATSTFPSEQISARVPRIGPELSTGDAIRIRRRACPSRLAIRCASASPCSGANQGRTSISPTSTGRGSTLPESTTSPVFQSSSKLSP